MSTVNRTVQTALRGQALHDAVDRMVRGMFGRSPYNMLSPTMNWVSGTQLAVAAGAHMRGTVTLRDGNPSTVVANIELLSSLAEGQRGRVEQDLASAAAQLAPAGGQPGPASTTSTRQAESRGSSADAWTQVTEVVQTASTALPGIVGQVRDMIVDTAAAARGEDANVKPGMRAPHAPDVAEPIPMWQRPWVRWALGATVVGGVGLLIYKAVK